MVYRTVASQLCSDAMVPPECCARLQQAMDAAIGQEPLSKAWTMRHALDAVLAVLQEGGVRRVPESDGRLSSSTIPVLDFGDDRVSWSSVDDRVMGGSSCSRMVVRRDCAVFEGELVNTGGGFASVRCVLPRDTNLSGAKSLLLRCVSECGRGDGYKISLKADNALEGLTYQLAFETPPNSEEVCVLLPLTAFKPSVRGQPVRAPSVRGEEIVQFGVMLSRYNIVAGSMQVDPRVKAGAFRLRLLSLQAQC